MQIALEKLYFSLFNINIQRYRNEYRYVLTIINYYTTFVSLFQIKDKCAISIVRLFYSKFTISYIILLIYLLISSIDLNYKSNVLRTE